jgi:hypothetical protein
MVKSAGTSIHQALIKESNRIDYEIHVNQRHASINNLPEQYRGYTKYIVIRKPEDWYRSFYRFFLGVEGYLSFMLNDPNDPPDGYIYPVSLDEFAKRSVNFRDTLLKYPNKAWVFNNLLRSQAHMHFITGYFKHAFSTYEPETLEQFNMSLYKWFWKNVGGEDAIFIPMSRLDIIEDIFQIKIPHINKTSDDKPKDQIGDETIKIIRESHQEFYDMLDDFDEDNLITYKEWKGQKHDMASEKTPK